MFARQSGQCPGGDSNSSIEIPILWGMVIFLSASLGTEKIVVKELVLSSHMLRLDLQGAMICFQLAA